MRLPYVQNQTDFFPVNLFCVSLIITPVNNLEGQREILFPFLTQACTLYFSLALLKTDVNNSAPLRNGGSIRWKTTASLNVYMQDTHIL